MKNRKQRALSETAQEIKLSSAAFIIVLLMAGCGGTPEKKEDKSASISSLTVESQKIGYGSIKPSARSTHSAAKAGVSASSFTVNPTENFNGFNPEIWNGQSSWTECNCGNNQPAPPPKIMTWNPEG